MDLLKSFSGGGGEEKKPAAATAHHGSEKHSKAELFASAKVVADAAKSAASGGSDKVDKGKAAGAASDLLDGAEEYGKLNEKGYGSYVDKAQGYLHKYESEGPAKPAEHHGEEKKSDGHDGGGAGDYLKMAQGFMVEEIEQPLEREGKQAGDQNKAAKIRRREQGDCKAVKAQHINLNTFVHHILIR